MSETMTSESSGGWGVERSGSTLAAGAGSGLKDGKTTSDEESGDEGLVLNKHNPTHDSPASDHPLSETSGIAVEHVNPPEPSSKQAEETNSDDERQMPGSFFWGSKK